VAPTPDAQRIVVSSWNLEQTRGSLQSESEEQVSHSPSFEQAERKGVEARASSNRIRFMRGHLKPFPDGHSEVLPGCR
jgi:hypothetical protein